MMPYHHDALTNVFPSAGKRTWDGTMAFEETYKGYTNFFLLSTKSRQDASKTAHASFSSMDCQKIQSVPFCAI